MTYNLCSDFLRYIRNLIVRQVNLDQWIGLPPVIDKLELLEPDKVHWEGCQTLALQVQCTSLLRTLESRLDGLATCFDSLVLSTPCAARFICISVAHRCCARGISSTKVIIGTSVLEEICVCLSFHICLFLVLFGFFEIEGIDFR